MNEKMLTRQADVDWLARQLNGSKDQFAELLDKAFDTFAPDDEGSGDNLLDVLVHNSVQSAAILADAITVLAKITTLGRWKKILDESIASTDETARTMEDVFAKLNATLVRDTEQFENANHNGPFATAFHQSVVQNLAGAITWAEALFKGYARTKALCAETGIDFDAVQRGDKEAIQRIVEIQSERTGTPVPDRLKQILGLIPTPAAANDAASVAQQIANQLGVPVDQIKIVADGDVNFDETPVAEPVAVKA